MQQLTLTEALQTGAIPLVPQAEHAATAAVLTSGPTAGAINASRDALADLEVAGLEAGDLEVSGRTGRMGGRHPGSSQGAVFCSPHCGGESGL